MQDQPNDAQCVVRVSSLVKRFGKTRALDGLSFSVSGGQIVGLLGRNGAGKSTLLRILSAQLRPDAGEAALFGQPVTSTAALGRLCLIGDTPDFGQLKTIRELFSVCAGLFPRWDGNFARELAGRFELPDKKRLKGFSRGMQTALLLCVGLASGAELTVFDEPSLGLDAVMRERFYDLLLKQREPGRTFVVSTHLIDEVARALDSAVLIDAGRLLCQGAVSELTALYLSVSGAPESVRAETEGFQVLREEEAAGSLIRHLRLNAPEDAERIRLSGRVQAAPMNLQRMFVFLTEEKEAERHDA